jgi:hypothetical protein
MAGGTQSREKKSLEAIRIGRLNSQGKPST